MIFLFFFFDINILISRRFILEVMSWLYGCVYVYVCGLRRTETALLLAFGETVFLLFSFSFLVWGGGIEWEREQRVGKVIYIGTYIYFLISLVEQRVEGDDLRRKEREKASGFQLKNGWWIFYYIFNFMKYTATWILKVRWLFSVMSRKVD